ncbi:uncharacterized protein LOC113519566 [Galleria mellonella]|uniref:Uncharacterized protein LOC113519566 n=1 Tax=Galleria mellonella TaxID=7137 RepID=A0A6J1WWK0_GALME|nr:uncharacterized protein LOC113519566 [Galleria mellonella]
MKILPLIVLLACVAWVNARPQEEGEARAAPSRGLLKRGLAKGKQTTTTTTQAPQEEAEYDEDYPAEGEEPSTEAPPSSTEGKKLIGGGVRPFRSNTDLLAILKRKRAEAAEAKLHGQSSSAAASSQDIVTEAPAKSSYSKKRFNNQPARESNNEEAPVATKPSRGRFGRPSSRSVSEPEQEEQNEAAAPISRGGRTFPRRGSN